MRADDLSLLISAAQIAGRIATQHFGQHYQITDKPDGAGPVTDADLAVNAALETHLRAARPDYGWLSEESADSQARLTTQRQFVVDPIDGTRAFIDGGKDWSHALAVVEDGVPVAGVVYLPMHDALFAARLGEGATLNANPIKASTQLPTAATVLAAKPNFDPKNWKGRKTPDLKRAFRSSLAYRMSLVAGGSFDGMLTLRPSWEWDIAAGTMIVTEAGGKVTDQHGAPLRFNNAHPQVPGVVAGGELLHRALLDRLEPKAATA